MSFHRVKFKRARFISILGEFLYEYEYDGLIIKSTVNEELIKTHNAVRYFGQSKDDIADEHLKNREFLK
jgi:hypothetical protein